MLSAAAPISFAVAFALVSAALPFAFALVVCDFWTVSQQMSPDFDMIPRVLGGFPRVLFAAGIADLGKRRRPAAFRADSTCKTAQKLTAARVHKARLALLSSKLRAGLVRNLLDTRLVSDGLFPCAGATGIIPPARFPRL